MCRFVSYLGEPILLENVVVKPSDSLINQSVHARETSIPTNGDGFGLGWYQPDISPNPARFVSILPAWNDENLLHLTATIKAPLFFSHVRAASSGGVNPYNCHPFIYNNWMFMHNGEIYDFIRIKRQLRNLLDDDIYNWIRGQTDSEHFFGLFLQLAKNKFLDSGKAIVEVLLETFKTIAALQKAAGTQGCSYYNICLTNGQQLIASRYCTEKSKEPESLHYLEGPYFWSEEDYQQRSKSTVQDGVLIASEQLTDFNTQWQTIPKNHLLLVEKNFKTHLKRIHLL